MIVVHFNITNKKRVPEWLWGIVTVSFKERIDAFHILGYHVVKFDCAGAVVSRDIGFHHLHQSWFQCITLDEVLSFCKKSISSTPYSVKFASPYIKLLLDFLHIPG